MRIAVPLLLLLAGCDYTAYTLPGTRFGCGGRFACTTDVATDTETGLSWVRTQLGSGEPWEQGRSRCESAATGGKTDWRLPTIDELATLHDPTFDGHEFDQTVFAVDGAVPFFSSEEVDATTATAWQFVELDDPGFENPACPLAGKIGPRPLGKSCFAFVRCVRHDP